MKKHQKSLIKTRDEIGELAEQLTPKNQSYVLNTINALLFSQQTSNMESEFNNKEEKHIARE